MKAKKTLLSILFIAVFGVYVIYTKGSTNNNNPLLNNNVSTLPTSNQNQNITQQTTPQNITQNSKPANIKMAHIQEYRQTRFMD